MKKRQIKCPKCGTTLLALILESVDDKPINIHRLSEFTTRTSNHHDLVMVRVEPWVYRGIREGFTTNQQLGEFVKAKAPPDVWPWRRELIGTVLSKMTKEKKLIPSPKRVGDTNRWISSFRMADGIADDDSVMKEKVLDSERRTSK